MGVSEYHPESLLEHYIFLQVKKNRYRPGVVKTDGNKKYFLDNDGDITSIENDMFFSFGDISDPHMRGRINFNLSH